MSDAGLAGQPLPAATRRCQPLAPLYNTLLRIDAGDRTGTRPAPDLAESWTISPDSTTYTS